MFAVSALHFLSLANLRFKADSRSKMLPVHSMHGTKCTPRSTTIQMKFLVEFIDTRCASCICSENRFNWKLNTLFLPPPPLHDSHHPSGCKRPFLAVLIYFTCFAVLDKIGVRLISYVACSASSSVRIEKKRRKKSRKTERYVRPRLCERQCAAWKDQEFVACEYDLQCVNTRL